MPDSKSVNVSGVDSKKSIPVPLKIYNSDSVLVNKKERGYIIQQPTTTYQYSVLSLTT
jgi:hypothetical protein